MGNEQHELGGHALRFSCDRDIDSGEITLAAGYDAKAVTGLGASPDEEVFNFGKSVALPAVEGGETAIKGIWTGDPNRAAGLTVQLRCKVSIGADSWIVPVAVTLPHVPAAPVGVPQSADEPDIGTAGF